MDAKNYLTADFLDILFEGKNKAYGAYLLRQEYDKRVARAVVVTFCLMFLLVGVIALSKYMKAHKPVVQTSVQTDVVLQEVDVKQRELPPPPPPPAPEPPKLKTQVKYTPPEVVKNERVRPEDEPPDMTKLKNVTISSIDKKGEMDGLEKFSIQESGNGITEAAPSADSIFTFVEQRPTFPGGLAALMKYLSEHIHYPSVARENGIQGTVSVQFVVNTDGSIVDVKAVGQKRGGGLEEEATRVVKGMPKWNPGKQNGRSVRVQFSLPVRFKLQ